MATLILKVTEKCNSNCYYCDVVRKKNSGSSMSLEVLEQVFIRINEFLLKEKEETVEILWHGGEPLLSGPEFYLTALEFQERYCNSTKDRIRYSMQTNLTCFSEDFIDVFRKLGMTSIGTSFDPEPNIRGPGTPSNSDLYNRLFMEKLEILESNGFGWGMIYVVTKKSLAHPLDVFFFLTNLLLTGGISLNPVLIYDNKRKDISITPEEFVDFLGAIFPVWWEHRYRYPDLEPFRSLYANIIDGNRMLGCVDSGDCTYHHINVAPDGETSQCGRSADWGLLQYGNIMDKSFFDILHHKERDQLKERVALLFSGECNNCRFWELCHGGCPLDAYSKHQSFMHKSEWCDAKRGFIEKYFEPISGVRFEPKNQ